MSSNKQLLKIMFHAPAEDFGDIGRYPETKFKKIIDVTDVDAYELAREFRKLMVEMGFSPDTARKLQVLDDEDMKSYYEFG